MEDFDGESYAEIDGEYEFDASQFFDFTKPELDSQIEEVERWFQVSGDYPHSPFIVKLNLDQILSAEGAASSPKSSKSRKSTKLTISSIDSKHGVPPSKKITQGGKGEEAAKAKVKQPHKLRSSSFMEPTASHLAKQKTVVVVHDKQQQLFSSSNRCPPTSMREKQLERSKSSPAIVGSGNLGTKRQKLETGFLKKGSHLRHKFSLPHKSSNQVSDSGSGVPREGGLETPLIVRSQRRSSNNSCASTQTQTPKHNNPPAFKIKHTKILQTRSLPRPTKSKTQLTEFQEFHFKTSERASHHLSAKENGSLSGETLLEEEFNKLSLGSKWKKTAQSERRSSANSKGSSSSSRGSFQSEFWKPSQNCGGRVRAHQPAITRSLDIR